MTEDNSMRVQDVSSGPEPRCVLVAEDDLEMRRLIAQTLRKDGYQVVEARDGVELLAYVKHSLYYGASRPFPSLIISDIRMPGWSGLEVLSALRRIDPCVPVLLITAFGDACAHAEAQRLGATEVLDKPFDLSDLRRLVGDLIPVSP
jgi:CheY-like chemotaxis protein